jgi:two-component system, cell cycle sensor histidine kinase and response regulator CckA
MNSDDWLRMALLAARMGTWDWNVATGKVQWSDNVETIFGLLPGSFEGTYDGFIQLVYPKDRAHVEAVVQHTLKGYVDDYEVIHRVQRPDGSLRWVEGRGRVLRDGAGNAVRMIGTVVDITARREAEDRAQRFANIVEHMQMGVFIYHLEDKADDRTLKLVAGNPAAEALVCRRVADYIGMSIDVIFPTAREKNIPAMLAEAVRSGKPGEYLVSLDIGHGPRTWFFRTFPTPEDCVGICFEDVTEKKRLEAQLLQAHKVEAIGQLAGGVAHDFNNLLTGILGYVEIAKLSLPPNSPLHEPLQEVFGAGERAKRLTSQLMTFARRQAVEPRVLNVNRLIRDFHRLLERVLREDVEIVLELSADELHANLDPGQFEQVLMNLAINARDAMPSGGRLIIQTAAHSLPAQNAAEFPPGEFVRLSVRDTGAGIDDAVRPHIFEPFFTTKGQGIGTGLGLATIHGIVTQSGGHISVESEPGEGSCFQILLPRVEAADAARAISSKTLESVPKGHETILLVEDEDMVRNVAAQTLRSYGYNVLAAGDAESALATAGKFGGNIELLLTDVVMPRVSGAELARRMQEQFPRVKVLYTSGYTENAIVHHGVLDPGIAFLPKPYTSSVLARKVRAVLDAK